MRSATNSRGSSLASLAARARSDGITVAGVLSGTSADGIDVALVRLGGQAPSREPLGPPQLLAFETRPFPTDIHARLRRVLDAPRGADGEVQLGLRTLAQLDLDLGRCFGLAAAELAARERLTLDLVGSHGQTIWHHDGEAAGPATLQIGNLAAVAQAAGASASGDFRQADVAAGGEGAPLSALVDPQLFGAVPRPAAILNLGGIGNLTYLGAAAELLAFDTGPAGCLLDGLARRLVKRPFDRGGELAGSGRAHLPLISALLDHAFFHRPPPRSTGRDTFGAQYVEAFLARAQSEKIVSPADLMATATAFVARTITLAIREQLPTTPIQLVVAGGGIHNNTLMEELRRGLQGAPASARARARTCTTEVISSAEYGVDPDAREALVFAYLAMACLLGVALSAPAVSGAAAGHVLGMLAPGPAAPGPSPAAEPRP
ncbi:MAG: anhydro-N-acetylmuramic acid kinase [Planctomycetota bacterium]|nr:anhydro-N-acetylmuramic acid kinase [Planctomycetota bacterium]